MIDQVGLDPTRVWVHHQDVDLYVHPLFWDTKNMLGNIVDYGSRWLGDTNPEDVVCVGNVIGVVYHSMTQTWDLNFHSIGPI